MIWGDEIKRAKEDIERALILARSKDKPLSGKTKRTLVEIYEKLRESEDMLR